MWKINLFGRHTNSASYRGTGPRKNVPSFRGNAESPRCCRELVCGKTGGIPACAGMTVKTCGMMIVIVALFATPSFADPTPAEVAVQNLAKKTVASKAYVDTKQDKIPATTSELYNISHAGSLVATTGSDGIVQERLIVPGFNALAGELGAILNQWNSLGGGNESLATMLTDLYLDYTGEDIAYNPLYSIPSLELISDLYNQLYYEFSTTLENATAGTPNNVAMYDNDGILADSRPTANAPTHNATTGALENGTNIATIAAVDTRQKKKECGGYEPGHENDMDYCWLWIFPED